MAARRRRKEKKPGAGGGAVKTAKTEVFISFYKIEHRNIKLKSHQEGK